MTSWSAAAQRAHLRVLGMTIEEAEASRRTPPPADPDYAASSKKQRQNLPRRPALYAVLDALSRVELSSFADANVDGDWLVAWRPDRDEGVIRRKDSTGFREWRTRHWRIFSGAPIIVDVSHDIDRISRELPMVAHTASWRLVLRVTESGPTLAFRDCDSSAFPDEVADITRAFLPYCRHLPGYDGHAKANPPPAPKAFVITPQDLNVIRLIAEAAVELIKKDPTDVRVEMAFTRACAATLSYLNGKEAA